MNSNIMIIESNFAERARILRKFKEYKLRHTLHFVSDCNEALIDLFYFNKNELIQRPQILLINYCQETLDFLDKIKADSRYRYIKIFILIDDNSAHYKEKLNNYKTCGIVNRILDFKNYSKDTYLDTADLYLQLLKIATDKNQYFNKRT